MDLLEYCNTSLVEFMHIISLTNVILVNTS